jgi:cell division protease FtsH
MGGRIAEEMFLDHMTTGAGNDIERSTDLARKMVCEFGMSTMGPLTFGKKEEQIFLGREINQHRDYSEATAIRIDAEVQSLAMEGYNRARDIIENNRDALIRIAEALLEREVIDGKQVQALIDGETLGPLMTADSGPGDEEEGDGRRITQQPPPSPTRPPGLEGEQPSPA